VPFENRAKWCDDPPEPGLYYWETCDQYGNPRPGFFLWEEGKDKGEVPKDSRFFGPIVGAMQPWETVPTDTPVVVGG
jgi:hypothetical protein